MTARRPPFTEGRIAFIKAELGITDAQNAVWDGYVQALKANLASMQSMHQQMRTLFDAKSPVERLDEDRGHGGAAERSQGDEACFSEAL
jgi:hypothetical protein